MSMSRRMLIHRVGQAGGVAAAYRTMAALGMLPVPAAYAGVPVLPPGRGRTVVILGAGIAGMVAALELGRAGWKCVVLEARGRAGGRNWTIRAGDEVREVGGVQKVAWEAAPHMYFNPGPGRIPHHHQGILSYCRQLGVPVEVMSNDNRAAWLQDDKGFGEVPQRARQVINDQRGYVAELAAKAVDQKGMDLPVGEEDREKLRAMLRNFGALDRDMKYRGSSRVYEEAPGGGEQAGWFAHPLELKRLLEADFWQFKTQFGEFWTMAPTMLQPVGGMGRIGEAFGKALGGVVRYGAEVTALRRAGEGARVEYRVRGKAAAVEAAHVICTIPLPVLRGIASDFSPAVKAAMAACDYVPAGKIAFQAERRFWELDEGIYGGVSWTTRDITQIWYPSAGLHEKRGVLVGAYIWSDKEGEAFAKKLPAQRAVDALADGGAVHRDYAKSLGRPVSVAWPNVPYSGAGWAEWGRAARATHYPVLLKGEGPYLFAGEHMSHITGWQEGAVLSAHYVLGVLAGR